MLKGGNKISQTINDKYFQTIINATFSLIDRYVRQDLSKSSGK
jgi:hypothetical protein